MRLDIDPKTHAAWTGVRQSIDRGGRVQRFKDRFGAGAGSQVAAGTAPAPPAGRDRQLRTPPRRTKAGLRAPASATVPFPWNSGRRSGDIRSSCSVRTIAPTCAR